LYNVEYKSLQECRILYRQNKETEMRTERCIIEEKIYWQLVNNLPIQVDFNTELCSVEARNGWFESKNWA